MLSLFGSLSEILWAEVDVLTAPPAMEIGHPAEEATTMWAGVMMPSMPDGNLIATSAPEDRSPLFGRSPTNLSIDRANGRLTSIWTEAYDHPYS